MKQMRYRHTHTMSNDRIPSTGEKVVAKLLLYNEANKVLVLYRSMTHPHFPGHPDFPGGEVEANEDWRAAICREVREEIGITITPDSVTHVFTKEHPHVTHVLYKAHVHNPRIRLSWEHSHYAWLVKESLLRIVPTGADQYYTDVVNYIISK